MLLGGEVPGFARPCREHPEMQVQSSVVGARLLHVQARLAQRPSHALALELTADRPKRGRPARTAGPALV